VYNANHGFEHGRIGLGQNAVSQVENVSGVRAGALQDFASGGDSQIGTIEAASWIEVALHWTTTDSTTTLVEVNVPVDTHDVGIGRGHEVEKFTGANAKQDGRHIEVGDTFENALGGGQRVADVLVTGQGASPRVKELKSLSTVLNLGPEKGNGDGDESIHEGIKERWVGVHHSLDDTKGSSGCTFDEITRDRERRTGKTDQRNIKWCELLDHEFHRFGDVGDVGVLEGPKAIEVGSRAKRVSDDWSASWNDIDAKTNGLDGDDNVGEENGCIDPVATNGLHGDLAGEVRISNGVKNRPRTAKGPVLGQRPPGLAHKPDGNVVNGLATGGP